MKPSEDPRFLAAIKLLNGNGARSFQLRYSDDEEPTVWMAVAEFSIGEHGRPVAKDGKQHYETAASLDPLVAVFRLCAQLMDGGQCLHCQRPTGFIEDIEPTILDELICWYQWDPELETFRRGCE